MSRAELIMVREALEGVVSPTMATTLLFEALEASGQAPPRTLEEMREFAQGPLDRAVRRRMRDEDASQIRTQVNALFQRALVSPARARSVEVELDVELDDADEGDGTETAQMTTVARPVPVVVLTAREEFADRLVLCLGHDRVKTIAVEGDAALSKAVFAYDALLVVLDGVSPTNAEATGIAAALRRLPNGATTIVWGSETEGGGKLVKALERAGGACVPLGRADEIEPLLDLILSRRSTE